MKDTITTLKSKVEEFTQAITEGTTERSILSKSELAAFIDVVGGSRTEVHGKPNNEVFTVLPGYEEDREDSTAIPAEITWKENTPEKEPEITITTYGDSSAGVHHSTTAPASQWRLRQTVDDGNLLTVFESIATASGEFEAALSVYGPPPESDYYEEHLLDCTP